MICMCCFPLMSIAQKYSSKSFTAKQEYREECRKRAEIKNLALKLEERIRLNQIDYIKYEVRVYPNGDRVWLLNGSIHREDGPAKEFANGDKFWYKEHRLHREDGPAREYANGDKYWQRKGKRHRIDGPAIEYANGKKEWYIKDKRFDEKDYKYYITIYLDDDGDSYW